jgi:hypothetical protein
MNNKRKRKKKVPGLMSPGKEQMILLNATECKPFS